MSSEQKTWYQRVLKITTVPLSISITFPQITDNLELKMRTHICCIFYLPWYVCLWWITKNSQQSWRSQVAFSMKVDCWIFVPYHGRLPPLDCKEGFRISRWPHSCLEKALPAWAEAHELLNPFICHSQRAGWDERKRGPGFLVGFSKPDHHAFTRLHGRHVLERKCCMKCMLSLVTINYDRNIQMFQR